MQKVALVLFWIAALTAFALAVSPNPPQLPFHPWDKLQHMAAFAVLAGLASAAFPRTPPLRLLLWLSLFGGAIELVQGTAPIHRDADTFDWLADIAACAAVLAAGALLRWQARQG